MLISCNSSQKDSSESSSPNIVFILIDDLGYKDLGCYGSEFYETPNIDKLASEGMLFTRSYSASAVCSPTRASILTGKHPARLHLTDWTGPDEWHPKGKLQTPEFIEQLPRKELSIAEALKKKDYLSIFLGKWHLGPESNHPPRHGFDRSVGATNAGAPPSFFFPYHRANWEGTGWPVNIPDLQEGQENEYLTDRLTLEALNFLDTIADRPFLLYLSHYAVHKPIEAKPELIQKYREKVQDLFPKAKDSIIMEKNGSFTQTQQKNPTYAAMIESVDRSVGKLVSRLQESGLSENTIIIFTSDNGGLSTYSFPLPGESFNVSAIPTSNLPLRAGKGWYYEGGIRVPTIVKWPGVVKPGSYSDAIITSTDFYPTLLAMTEIDLMPEQHKDGENFVQVLKGTRISLKRKNTYWHYPHYHSSGQKPVSVIRNEKYKLIHWIEEDYIELYDLENDPGENRELSEMFPDIASSMLDQLESWRSETAVQMPERKK
jgi:arylsulfatase A-like enzyme